MKRRETMNEQLKIALFGATGKTGIYYLEMALDKGTLWARKSLFRHLLEISGLTPQGQSSERNLPGTIVPWRDIFDKW